MHYIIRDMFEENGDFFVITDYKLYMDKYIIKDILGKGGIGGVYLAYDIQKQRNFAMKISHLNQIYQQATLAHMNADDLLKRLQRETDFACSLKH